MKNYFAWLSSLVLLALVGCGTPGDASLRAGNPEQAATLYRDNATRGNGDAAVKLGLLIALGRVSSTKYGEPVQWYVKGCELGVDAGCHNAGNAYEYGKEGAGKDYSKAKDFYQKAAERGKMESQYNLGSLYSNQYFNDDVEGLKWMLLAEKQASSCGASVCKWIVQDPPGHRNKLRSRMKAEQIEQASELAKSWKPKS